MVYLTQDMDFKSQVMGSRFARCLGIAPNVLTTDQYQEIRRDNSKMRHHKAVALSLDKSENENPSIIGLDWNEV